MKVLAVSNAAWPAIGGIEVLLGQLLPALRDRGHDITLLTSALNAEQPQVEEIDGITVHRTELIRALAKRDPGLLSRDRQRVKRLLHDLSPDLVHAHDPGPNLWAVVKAGAGIPILTTLHIGLRSAGVGAVAPIAPMLAASSWVTGVSDNAVEEVLEIEPALTGRTSVIENGIDIPAPSDEAVVPGRILLLGRLVPQKGFDLALRALAAVDHPDAHIVVAGDGSERAALEALATELDIPVTFLGTVVHRDVARLIAQSQIVALPSRYEGQPLVALEVGAMGRPMLSTIVDGLGSVVVDGETGRVVPPDDLEAVTTALDTLLGDPALCDRLGAAARVRVAREYGMSRCVDAYDALYRRLVAQGD